MRATLKCKISFVYDFDESDYEYDIMQAVQQWNDDLTTAVEDRYYVQEYIDAYTDNTEDMEQPPLKDIIEVYVDAEYAYITVECLDMSDEQFVDTFKVLLHDFVTDATSPAFVDISGDVYQDTWDYFRQDYTQELTHVEGEGEVSINYDMSDYQIVKEVK